MESFGKKITNQKEWEELLLRVQEKTFLHSFAWGKFQQLLGNTVIRLAFDHGLMQVLVVRSRRGSFLLVPHGPVVYAGKEHDRATLFKECSRELVRLGKSHNAHYVRIAPVWEEDPKVRTVLKQSGWKRAPLHVHPERTWELDITPSEGELLAGMRKTTRYLVRKGLKDEDLVVTHDASQESLEEFCALHDVTVARQHFTPFSKEYFQREMDVFSQEDAISVFLAKKGGKVYAGAIIVFWGGVAFYHHGASIADSKVPASYLLQWHIILEAKKRGCTTYNFWGVVQDDQKTHPWYGLSLFKKGFGGREKQYIETHDLSLSRWYRIWWMIERWRKWKKRL